MIRLGYKRGRERERKRTNVWRADSLLGNGFFRHQQCIADWKEKNTKQKHATLHSQKFGSLLFSFARTIPFPPFSSLELQLAKIGIPKPIVAWSYLIECANRN